MYDAPMMSWGVKLAATSLLNPAPLPFNVDSLYQATTMEGLPIDMSHPAVRDYLSLVR